MRGISVATGNMYDWAWMAGFMDGEGYIAITRQRRGNRPSPTYRARISVGNQVIKNLEVFRENYGGTIKREKACFRWECPSFSKPKLLADLIPFLRQKKEQAELVLEYLKIEPAYGCKPMSREADEKRNSYFVISKKLNEHNFKRG